MSEEEQPSGASKIIRVLLAIALIAGGYYAYSFGARAYAIANPVKSLLPLPESHVGLNTDAGSLLLKESARADYLRLTSVFRAQQYRSYCGVATGVMSVNALKGDDHVDQDGWFSDDVAAHRTRWNTFFGGMTLSEFAGMIQANGLEATHHHGGSESLAAFREIIRKNMERADDLLVVNYSRKALDQKGWGHFSPVAAYHVSSDRALILDVGAHKYEPSWVKLERLWAAMATPDSDSGKNRGYVLIQKK